MNDDLQNNDRESKSRERADDELTAKIHQLEQLAQDNLNGWKRATADYQNLVKETAKEREYSVRFANEQLIQQLLPLVDYFDYAFADVPDEQSRGPWMKGIHHIYDQLMKVLEDHGVTPLETVGKIFDPTLHEAVDEVESTEVTSHHILEQTQRGFLMHGTCIRPAKVKIVK